MIAELLTAIAVLAPAPGCVDQTPWRDYQLVVRDRPHWLKIHTRGRHRARWFVDGERRQVWDGSRQLWLLHEPAGERRTVVAWIHGPCGRVEVARRIGRS